MVARLPKKDDKSGQSSGGQNREQQQRPSWVREAQAYQFELYFNQVATFNTMPMGARMSAQEFMNQQEELVRQHNNQHQDQSQNQARSGSNQAPPPS